MTFVTLRELSAEEVKQVSGGTVHVFKPTSSPLPPVPKHPKPLQP